MGGAIIPTADDAERAQDDRRGNKALLVSFVIVWRQRNGPADLVIRQPSEACCHRAALFRNSQRAHRNVSPAPNSKDGTVVIRDGKIEAVGPTSVCPRGAQTIEGRGLSVYPGMIDAGTSLGLVEVPQGAPGTVDTAEVGDLNPNAKAIIAVNPHSAHIAVTRVDGITSALTLPYGRFDFRPGGDHQSGRHDAAGNGSCPLGGTGDQLSTGRQSRWRFRRRRNRQPISPKRWQRQSRQLEQIRKMLHDAEAYGRAHDAYAKDKTLPRPNQKSCWKRWCLMCAASDQ